MLDVGALYAEHGQRIVRYLARRTGDPDLADDLAQEVWLRVHRAADTYAQRGDIPVTSWLYRIAANVHTDWYRREKARPPTHSTDRVGELGAVTADAGGNRQLTLLELETLLAQLQQPKQRQVIMLRFLRGLNIRETSAETGITENGVKKLQARALVNLRKLMEAA